MYRTDVKKILPNGLLTDELAAGIAQVYNTKFGRIVTAPSGAKVALSQFGEVGASPSSSSSSSYLFVDPTTGSVFSVDPLTLTTQENTSATSSQDSSLELKRSAVQTAVSSYKSLKYLSEDSAGSVYAKDNQIQVILTGEKANLRNFWSGKWTSTWIINVTGASATISGDIKVS